jgi:hypothetical protein
VERDRVGGVCRLKAATAVLAAFLVLGGLVTLSMPVEAAASAVAGVRASVIGTGEPQFVELRFPFSVNDPNQATGDFIYNVTVNAGGGWANVGELSIGDQGNGLRTTVFDISGGPSTVTFNITADDGSGMVDSACTVTVNTANQYDYDSCGSMSTTWQGLHCLPRDPEPSPFGFNYIQHVQARSPELRFWNENPFSSAKPLAGLALPGDSAAITIHFEVRLSGSIAKSNVILSEVDTVPSAASAPTTTVQTGAGATALIIELDHRGSDTNFRLLRSTDGTLLEIVNQDIAVDPGSSNAGWLRSDPYAGVIQAHFGGETFTVPDTIGSVTGSSPGAFHSMWIRVPTPQLESYYDRSGTNATSSLCLTTLSSSLGGSTGVVGEGVDSLPGFEGEGGRIGAPSFPGLNMTQAAEAVNMDVDAWALVVAGILLLALVLGGFALARVPGAAAGAVAWLPLAGLLSLVPLWVIVVVFLLAVTGVVLGFRGGGGG